MPTDLRTELRQRKPFTSAEQEAYLSLVRTAAVLGGDLEQLLKPHGLTSPQYNVLRILRGAEPEGLCRNDLRDRMLTRMPDMTRLLDRMEEAGLVARSRESDDRRMVTTRITAEGRRLLDALDEGIAAAHRRHFRHLSSAQLRTLIELLGAAREGVNPPE